MTLLGLIPILFQHALFFLISVPGSDWVGFKLSDWGSSETVGIHRAPKENTPGRQEGAHTAVLRRRCRSDMFL